LIFCVRGGFGAAHLLPHIDWNLLRTRKIPFVGYSDITALHMAMLQQKVSTPIAAPMPLVFNEALLENKDNQYTREFMRLAFSDNIHPGTEITMPGNEKFNVIKTGYALCLPVVANLSVLTSLCGTKWFPKLRHRILIIEDINEPLYKIDRYLTQLLQSGALRDCEGLLLGQFNDCGEEEEKRKLFKRFAENIKGPVIMDFPFGHDFPSISINMRHHFRIEKNGKIFLIDT
jgi:muramoyltetrapeptide carboxypeptidase